LGNPGEGLARAIDPGASLKKLHCTKRVRGMTPSDVFGMMDLSLRRLSALGQE